MSRRRKDRELLDVREQTARLLEHGDAALHWCVSLIASDERLQEQIMVTAPNIEAAERAASAFARHNDGRCERFVVERIHACADEGCDVEMLTFDPRYAQGKGAPSIEEVEDPESQRRCNRHAVAAGR